ncbi:MAG TPA: hypothetical protein VGD03_06835 [Frankiaceae bacterium]
MNVHDFYTADLRRQESDEVTFGDGWTLSDDPPATYRVSWVADTGELYTVREPHPGGLLARYLDQLGVEQADVDELTVEVLGSYGDREAVEAALQGWPEAMMEKDSLRWVRAAAASPAG